MATVVRKLKPKRIASAKAYRRHDKHKHHLKNRPFHHDQDGFFVPVFLAIRSYSGGGATGLYNTEYLASGCRDVGTGTKDRGDTLTFQEVIVLGWDNPANHDHDV